MDSKVDKTELAVKNPGGGYDTEGGASSSMLGVAQQVGGKLAASMQHHEAHNYQVFSVSIDIMGLVFGLSVLLICFGIGWRFLDMSLYRNFEAKDKDQNVQAVWSLVFSLSCNLLILVIFEIMGIMDPTLRQLDWHLTIWSLLIMIIFILPLYLNYRLLSAAGVSTDTTSDRARLMSVSLLLWVFLLYCLWYFRHLTGIPEPAGGVFHMKQVISLVGVIGTWLIAILSGYATVSVPYTYLSLFVKPVEMFEITSIEAQINKTVATKEEKKKEMSILHAELDSSATSSQQPGLHGIFMNAWGNWNRATDRVQEQLNDLEKEVEMLDTLKRTLSIELSELKLERARSIEARTVWGHIKNLAGYVMTIYCFVRMYISLKCLIWGENLSSDPVGAALSVSLRWLSKGHIVMDVSVISQYLTLVFIGAIIAMSLQGFFYQVRKVFSVVRGHHVSSFLVILFTEVVGCYAISSLLLIRKNVPQVYRHGMDVVIGGDLDFQFFHRWFNGLFLASAMIAMTVFYIQYQAKVNDPLLPTFSSKDGLGYSRRGALK